MLVQLESGIPVFQIIVNIAASNYGFVSHEFSKAVKEINSGVSQIEALENLIKRSQSVYFKRVLWQISNGMRSGSDMTIVIKDSVDNLNKEQAIQIQSYGSRLNPLVMFYMLIAVILPSLGLTFFIIISSMLGLSGSMMKLMFAAIFVFVVLIQIMFLGMIRTRRPSLL
jgi:flagellar protein FlaJ